MFFILFNQNIVRLVKDNMIATQVGAEIINFIKLGGELPAGMLFVYFYAKLTNAISAEKAFRYIVGFFIAFFGVFCFILFPAQNSIHPDPAYVEDLILNFPNLKWILKIWGNWSIVLFYILGELWPIIVFSILFWQLANKITKIEEAGRFYSFFSLFAQTNMLITGLILKYISSPGNIFSLLFSANQAPEIITSKSLGVVIVGSGIITLALHKFIEIAVINKNSELNSNALNPGNSDSAAQGNQGRGGSAADKSGPKQLGLKQSLGFIWGSPYLGLICILLIGYSMSINLIEGLWLFKINELYPEPSKFLNYQAEYLYWTGIFTLFSAFLGSHIISKLGWRFAALITPISILVIGLVFFISVIADDKFDSYLMIYSQISSLHLIAFSGALFHVFGKGTKYSLFDPTKEMAYIPLSEELKTKGKAAVDIIGSKVGKAIGASIQALIFVIFPSLNYNDIPIALMVIFIIVAMLWVVAVIKLARKYYSLLNIEQ
jgi:ADP/ATP carrier protein family